MGYIYYYAEFYIKRNIHINMSLRVYFEEYKKLIQNHKNIKQNHKKFYIAWVELFLDCLGCTKTVLYKICK